MMFTLKDWKRLRQPIFFLLAVVCLVALCIYYTYEFSATQRQATQIQENLRRHARMQLQQYEAEKNDREIFSPRYQALITQGFIGEERRQAWVSALSEIQKTHQLFEIHYEIGRLTPVNAGFLPPTAPFGLQQSAMKIRLALLHEGDLLTLLEALKEKKLSPYIVKSCEIAKIEARLSAQCEIDWYTLLEPANVQVTPAL